MEITAEIENLKSNFLKLKKMIESRQDYLNDFFKQIVKEVNDAYSFMNISSEHPSLKFNKLNDDISLMLSTIHNYQNNVATSFFINKFSKQLEIDLIESYILIENKIIDLNFIVENSNDFKLIKWIALEINRLISHNMNIIGRELFADTTLIFINNKTGSNEHLINADFFGKLYLVNDYFNEIEVEFIKK